MRVLSCVRLFAIPWTEACQPPLLMEFSRQKYWSGLPFPSPGDLPDSGIKPKSPASLALQADSLMLSHQGSQPVVTLDDFHFAFFNLTVLLVKRKTEQK